MNKTIFKYNIDDAFGFSEAIIKGERKYYVEGYASTIDEDKAGEVLDHSAQQDIFNQIQSENITMDIEHEEWYDSNGKVLSRPKNEKIPVAKVVDAKLTPKGTWIKAEINPHLRSFKELWGSITDGFLKAFSVAFYPVSKSGNVIKALRLVNITLTGSPVNPQATFSATMKSASAYLDSLTHFEEDLKAEKPDTNSTNLEDQADSPSTSKVNNPDEPKTKSEDKKMAEDKKEIECKECDKEFESQEALDKHYESAHKKEEKKAEVKAEVPNVDVSAELKAVKDSHEAELKALKESHEAEIKALREQVAVLNKQLEEPVMKAKVEKTEVKMVKPQEYVTPLKMIK